jgi:hypothetical protein
MKPLITQCALSFYYVLSYPEVSLASFTKVNMKWGLQRNDWRIRLTEHCIPPVTFTTAKRIV